MNSHQRLVMQIVKDDLKKPIIIAFGTSFKRQRRLIHFCETIKNGPIDKIRDFKNFNKKMLI